MVELYTKIETLCKDRGTNITAMCKGAGISRAPLTELKMGRTKTLSIETLSKIAAYFDVSLDYLLGNESKSDTVTDDPSDEMLQMVKDIAAGKSGSAGLIIGKGGKKPVVHTLSEEEENIMLSILEAMRKNKDN